MSNGEITISNLESVQPLLDERGISPADIREAIRFGQETGRKFYWRDDENRYLVRARIGKFNVYAEYSFCGDGFILHTAYAHRLMIASDNQAGRELQSRAEIEWSCYSCQVKVEEVDNIALRYNEVELPEIDGYRCPQCGLEMIPENTVMTMLFMAEQMLEAK